MKYYEAHEPNLQRVYIVTDMGTLFYILLFYRGEWI